MHGHAPANASTAGDTMAMKVVLQLPPRLSSRMRVSLESLGRGSGQQAGYCEWHTMDRQQLHGRVV